MKISKSTTKDLIATLNIEIIEKDYLEKVEKILKDYRKTATMSGFRKGKTPMSIINKKYRASVIAEEVNKLLQDQVYKYINENKINILGSPIPIDDENIIDWNKDSNFNFKFEIGLAPNFEINISKKNTLGYYIIQADKKLLDKYCNDIAKRYGKMSSSDTSKEDDLILCNIEQLDLEGNLMKNGIQNEATVSMEFINEKKIQKKFLGVKVTDTLKINVLEAFKNHSDLSAMLNVDHTAIHNLSCAEFQFTVNKISSLTPAELDVELFDKVYGKGKIKTIKQFRAKIQQEAEANFLTESDRMFKNDVVKYLLEKNKLNLPDEFLKKWLLKTSKKPLTLEQIESEYGMYSESLKWQLIESRILDKYNIKVTNEEVIHDTKELVAIQMKQYGQPDTDDKQLIDIANNILKNEDEKKKIYNQLIDKRTLAVYKENFQIKEKKISYDDFIKLAAEK